MSKYKERTRQELYDLVLRNIDGEARQAIRIVGYVGLRKTCVKHGIPTPPGRGNTAMPIPHAHFLAKRIDLGKTPPGRDTHIGLSSRPQTARPAARAVC